MKSKIRVAIVGVGNCASSLIQGIEYYKDQEGIRDIYRTAKDEIV